MSKHVLRYCLLVAAITGPLAAVAAPGCTPTARIPAQNYPGEKAIPPGNDLLQPAGKAITAQGQKITIQGRVLDKNCMPVKEAIVELWQNSPTGRWLLAGADDLASVDPVFAGAGRTYTDNDGQFTFVTAFPAPVGKRAPFVNVKVSGEGIPDLTTALYFSNDTRNAKDDAYGKLAGKLRDSATIRTTQDGDELTGTIDLVVAAKAPYRTY